MQDCNDSDNKKLNNSSANMTSINTSTSSSTIVQLLPSNTSTMMILTSTVPVPNESTSSNVLRQRLQQPSTCKAKASSTNEIPMNPNGSSIVEQSSSSQMSPSKKSTAITPNAIIINHTSTQCQTNNFSSPSSSSSSNSNSNSTTASVIATPILARNGNAFATADSVCKINYHDDDRGVDRNTSDRIKLFAPTKIPLPTESTLFDDKYLSTTEVVASSASSSSSSSLSYSPISTTTTTPTSIPSSSSSSSPTTSTASATLACKNSHSTSSSTAAVTSTMEAQLLQWHDMPKYLQFNPYVLRGYRPLQTFKGCLLSLFYWHNETVNIFTHAIPIVYILAIVPGLMPWEKEYRFLSFCHLFGSVAPWCGSFVYHLFMNIEKGEQVYRCLLKLDMVGIWVSQSFGALPLVTATTHCFTTPWKWCTIISYCLLSLWGLYKALTASSPWQRRLCFALPFTMRSILTCLRTMGMVGGSRVALSHVYLQDGVSILGGAIGAMRIPEKWFPGLVDFYLNSHNIMHVLVVVAVYSMHKATIKDFEWMSTATCEGFINTTSEAIESSNIEL